MSTLHEAPTEALGDLLLTLGFPRAPLHPPAGLLFVARLLTGHPTSWNARQLSNVNYEQRDNFQMEIAAVEQANRREQDDFENQVLVHVRDVRLLVLHRFELWLAAHVSARVPCVRRICVDAWTSQQERELIPGSNAYFTG